MKTKTRILYSVTFFKTCLYEVMCKNMAFADKSQMSMLTLALMTVIGRHDTKICNILFSVCLSVCLSVSLSLSLYIYIYIRARAHTHTHARTYTHTHIYIYIFTHIYINVDILSIWKIEAEYYCKSTTLQSVTIHHSLSYNVTKCTSSYTVP